MADVRYGSKADVTLLNFDVRFTPESGHLFTASRMSALGQQQTFCHDFGLARRPNVNRYAIFSGRHFSAAIAMTRALDRLR
jgi:hypothetical protein